MIKPSDVIEAGQEGSLVAFHWDVINKCQFECSYCYATDFNKSEIKRETSYAYVLLRLNWVKTDFEIDLLGGEPTLHPNLRDIVQSLDKNVHCKRITLYTNGAAPLDIYAELNSSKLIVCVSYHAEYHKRILNKIVNLRGVLNGPSLFVEVNLHPKQKYFEQTRELLYQLKDRRIDHGVNIVRENEFWDGIRDEGYDEAYGEFISNVPTNEVYHYTTQGTVYLTEAELIENKIKYTGFECESLLYKISVTGEIRNMCSQTLLPILPGIDDIRGTITCPVKDICPCPDMLNYKKVNRG